MRYTLLLKVWFIWFLVPYWSLGQTRCTIKEYTSEDGLSHPRGTEIIKDEEGFIWVGTWDGINRFDGNNFITYKSVPGDRAGLKSDRIDQILEDKVGNLWLKGVDEFYRFNKASEGFTPLSDIIKELVKGDVKIKKALCLSKGTIWFLTENQGAFYLADTRTSRYIHVSKGNKNLTLPSDKVNFIYKDAQKQSWVATSGGLSCFRESIHGVALQNKFRTLNRFNFKDCCEDMNNLYFSSEQGSIIIINKNTFAQTVIHTGTKGLNAIRVDSRKKILYCTTFSGELVVTNLLDSNTSIFSISPGVPLLSIFQDRRGNLWLEPESKGTILFNPERGSFKWFFPEAVVKKDSKGFYKVFEDASGKMWAYMRAAGLAYYNPEKGTMETAYQESDGELHELPRLAHGLYYDNNNLVWLCTEMGISKLILHGNTFIQRRTVPAKENEESVRALFLDRRKRLWVGTRGGRVQVFNASNHLLTSFEGLAGPVYSLIEDAKGRIWIGTKYKGVYIAEPQDTKHLKYKLFHFDTSNSSLNDDNIYALYEDCWRRIWIGTFGGGLNLAEFKAGNVRFKQLDFFKRSPGKLGSRIRNINADVTGNLWMATTDGLFILKVNGRNCLNPQVNRYTKIPGDESSLGDNDVQFVFRDKSGKMWLTTSGCGVCKVEGTSVERLTFRSYLRQNGLANDYVVSMTQDSKGRFWIGTQSGLTSFDSSLRQFRNFDHNDGLLRYSFSEATCANLGIGGLVFGTNNGYVQFNPDKLRAPDTKARIVLTSLQINNLEVTSGSPDSILKANINYTNELNLKYDQNTVSIGFTSLDLAGGRKFPLFFRLKEIEKNWQSDHLLRMATYTNLSPGTYTFEVSSANRSKQRTLIIHIQPPFWRSTWACILYFIAILLLLKKSLDLSKTFLKLRHDIAVQRKMTDLKLDFFTNVSHELRTPLTLILNPLEEIEKREDLSEKGVRYLELIKRNVERMVRFMNQWLDFRRIQAGKYLLKVSNVEMNSLLNKSTSYFSEVCREKNVKIENVSLQKEVFAWVDEEKLDIVIYNVLANAVKHTGSGKTISLNVEVRENSDIQIHIVDQGPGVPENKLDKIFELYYTDEAASKGSGIGLAFSRELVKLHHGKIHATNNEHNGLTVTITLKAGKEHFDSATEFVAPETSVEYAAEELSSANQEILISQAIDTRELPLVLLVEDNSELRGFLRSQLSSNFRIAVAKNGLEGLKKAKTLAPNLILSDVMMPVLNGIEMLKELKDDQDTSHIPVILLTARSSVEHQIEGLSYGADYYISKPFKTDLLLCAIVNLIAGRRRVLESIINRNIKMDLKPGEVVITSRDEEFLKKVITVVEEQMGNPDFNIDMIAEKVAMSRTRFYTKFKSLTNLAPVEFVREIRLERAKQLFDAGETNVSTVAYSVGFNNPKYFTTNFKEKFGVAPKEYLKSLAKS